MIESRSIKKVAIVGAGIVGLYLAWKLSEKRWKVTVFEKRNRIGKECCSGLFSERILKFIPSSQKLIQNRVDFVLIHFPRKTIRVNFKRQFVVMDHAQLDRLVADLARKAGAILKLNVPNKTEPDFSSFFRVIGCDGAQSETRKKLKLKEPYFRLGRQHFISSPDFSNGAEIWPSRKGGFDWKIPHGYQTEFGALSHRQSIKNFPSSNFSNCGCGLICQGLRIPKNPKVTLCGEAAGLTKPWSGGGVVWGLSAADMLLKNFPDLLKYRQAVRNFFLPQIILSKIALKLIYFLGFNLPWVLPKKLNMEGDYAFGYSRRW